MCTDPKFIDFIKLLTQKGYFKNIEEGSDQWNDRYQKARDKFLQRNTQSSTSTSASVSTANTEQDAEKYKDLGNDLLRKKQFSEAVEMYKKAAAINPKNHVYHTNMAAAYVQLREYDLALECCEKALECNDRYAKSYKWMGQVYELTGKFEEALENYEQALRLEPDVVEYQRRVDEMKQKMQQTAAADPFASMFGGMMGGAGGGGNPLASMFGGAGAGAGGMPDFGALFNNPQVMQMAQQMMENPMMRQMAANMARSMGVDMDDNGMPRFSEEQLAELEGLEEVQTSDKLKQFVQDLRENGVQIMEQYRDDPEVNEFMMKAASKVFGSNPMFADMFGGGGGGSSDGDDDASAGGNMYA